MPAGCALTWIPEALAKKIRTPVSMCKAKGWESEIHRWKWT